MLITYRKLKTNGQEVVGTQEFISLSEAQARLIEPGELLIELKQVFVKKIKPLTLSDRLDFTYQMHQLMAAGLPVYESLISLKEKQWGYQPLIEELAEKIKTGVALSTALAAHPESFNHLYIALIQASEASGELEQGFEALKTLLQKQVKLLKILKAAFVYPLILLFFAFLIVNALLFFIIPSLSELFEGREVGALTATILAVSRLCLSCKFELIALCIGIGLAVVCFKKSLKRLFFKVVCLVPFCQRLLMSLKLENFFSCLGLLLTRGITLKEALVLSKQVLHHEELEQRVEGMIADITMGKKFSDSIKFPFPLVAQRLISLSEATGKLASSCQMLCVIFQEEVEKKLQQLTSFLQPLLLALIGLIIGMVILSILMPLTDVGGFI
jgi:general secretion pathway protein F/type IV pilus assembly protein PilC